MNILASKGRIPYLQKAVEGFYEPYVLGKQKKVSFIKSGNTRKLQRLELVHTDVYGPTSVASIGGSCYYVTFIDDSSRKYSSREFIEYCAENGIRMLKTVLKTPQQNGVAERMNRTLNEIAKSMRLHAEFPQMFWEDSVTTAAYLINHGPSAITDSSNLTKPNQKDQVVLEDSLENLANKSIVTEHGLSSEITRGLGGSSDTSEGSKNNGSFEDSGRTDKEDSKDRASSEEGGFETPQLRRSTSRAPLSYIKGAMMRLVDKKGEMKRSASWRGNFLELQLRTDSLFL
ncbi:retrovirus-related pol polyprotein from transposon TNT 1-94 [Tanacetum coccineum]|uniref:Retrovirus-related pol polyprotein from transposon TNT 1-94 n=1 Tax=Tanacetum coccineum TaxID=301880 RepID=A0ABQ5EQ46_9ASTR